MKLQRHHMARLLVIAVSYFLTGYAGLQFPFHGSSVTLVWAPSGIALAVLIVWGWRYFPAVFVGALLVNLTTSEPVIAAVLIACGNTLAAALPAGLIRKTCGPDPLSDTRRMLIFLAAGVIGGPALSALLGTTSLSLVAIGHFAQFGAIWQGWFLGDLVGAVVVAPLVLFLLHWKPGRQTIGRYGEFLFICVTTLVVSSVIQTTPLISKPQYLFVFVSLPFVIWGALRFGLHGALAINAIIVADIIGFATAGNSIFVPKDLERGLENLYGYVLAFSAVSLFLGASMEGFARVTTHVGDGDSTGDVHRLRRNLAVIIGVIGFGLSGAASWYTHDQLAEAERVSARQYRLAFEASLREELGRATDALVAVQTLFHVQGSVFARTFNAMIAPWVTSRPGVAALEWVPYVAGHKRSLLEKNAEFRGVKNFAIHELVDGQPRPAEERDGYFPVFFVFPHSGNEEVIGYDLASEPIRARAIRTAIETGDITLTEPLNLIQSTSTEATVLAFLAVENRLNPEGDILGMAVGILRISSIIRHAARVARIPLDFELHLADLNSRGAKKLIFTNRDPEYAREHLGKEVRIPYNPNVSNFSFGYRDWTIVLHPSQSNVTGLVFWQPWAIFVFGATVSILLLVYLRSLTRTERHVVDLVNQRTRELDDARLEAEQAMTRAQQADRAKSEFIAHMSHEFRSPLTSILGYAQLAEDCLDQDQSVETLRSYIGTIRAAGRHVLSLIGDILDISKIEAGKLILENAPFDLRAVCEEVTSMMMVPAQAQNNKLHLEIAPDLPRWVIGDRVRVKQILTNLVSNAIKFTKFGNIRIAVIPLAITDDDLSLRISVSDEGIGIPQNRLETIFDSFAQVDSSTARRYGGTGLGLAICQHMVGTMGGTLRVESTEGTGSTFWIDLTLPRSTAAEVADFDKAADLDNAPVERQPVIGRNLLVVEDIEINRILARKLLEKHGHTVTEASDGQEALDILEKTDFDAVLMDVHMPVVDGIEATRQIRKLADPVKATIPVLALTADISNTNIDTFKAAGFDAYCTKPLDIPAINRELQLLENRMLDKRLSLTETAEEGGDAEDTGDTGNAGDTENT